MADRDPGKVSADVNWREVARLVLTSREMDRLEEQELVPAKKVLYQFSARGHDMAQVLLGLQLKDGDAACGYYRSRPLLLALGVPDMRLANALAHHFERGYNRAVIMNSDGPTLPLAHLSTAFTSLDYADISLGMGHDGGYYLIGMKRLEPTLFQDISWSTGRVIPQTIEVCRHLGLKIHKLPEWYDVDVEDDLDLLLHDLRRNPTSAPYTYAFLQHLGKV